MENGRLRMAGKNTRSRRWRIRYLLVPIRAGRSWVAHHLTTHGAALAYYAVFALSPILVIAVSISGLFFGRDAVAGRIVAQMEGLLGHAGASLVQRLLEASYLSGQGGIAVLLGLAGMLMGATGLFVEMSAAFERIFDAKRQYRHVMAVLLMDRLRGLAISIGVGFLLIVSLLASTATIALGSYLTRGFGTWLKLAGVFQAMVSLAAMTALILLLYRLLIPVRLPRRILLTGAAISAVLFEVGKWGIGLYLGRGAIMSTFGAAGSLAVILLWVYYVSLIMLYGAEITHQLYRLHRLRQRAAGCVVRVSRRSSARKECHGENRLSDAPDESPFRPPPDGFRDDPVFAEQARPALARQRLRIRHRFFLAGLQDITHFHQIHFRRACLRKHFIALFFDVVVDVGARRRRGGGRGRVAWLHFLKLGDLFLGAGVLDAGCVHHEIFLDRLAHSGVENFVLQLGVHGQFPADLFRQLPFLFPGTAARFRQFPVFGKHFLDGLVVGVKEIARVFLLGGSHIFLRKRDEQTNLQTVVRQGTLH